MCQVNSISLSLCVRMRQKPFRFTFCECLLDDFPREFRNSSSLPMGKSHLVPLYRWNAPNFHLFLFSVDSYSSNMSIKTARLCDDRSRFSLSTDSIIEMLHYFNVHEPILHSPLDAQNFAFGCRQFTWRDAMYRIQDCMQLLCLEWFWIRLF